MKQRSVKYKTIDVGGINIFYREAGNRRKYPIILLNGIPDCSGVFEDLMNELKTDYYMVAPDLPGFGNSDAPSTENYDYTFENISKTIERFMHAIGLAEPSVYALGDGGPIAFRIAMQKPDAFRTFILQNANAYEQGWGPAMVNHDQYMATLRHLARPGREQIHIRLCSDYASNIFQYPRWQKWLRQTQPKMLLVWGKNDVFFPTASAEAFKDDVPGTRLYVYDTGHLALEEHHREIAGNIRYFLG